SGGLSARRIVRSSGARLSFHAERELADVLERDARTAYHGAQRVFCNDELDAARGREASVEPFDEGAAAGQVDADLHHGGIQLRGHHFEHLHDGRVDFEQRLFQSVCDFGVGERDRRGEGRQDVGPRYHVVVRGLFEFRHRGAYRHLDVLRRAFADTDVVLLADVVLYLFGEDVARHVDALAAYDAAERDAGDFRRAAADVDDHVPFGRFHVEPCAERRRHRLVYHVHFPAAGVFGRFADGAYFHVRGTRRDADDHAQRRAEEVAAHLDLLYHAPEHQFRGVEIGNDAVLERTDGA